MQLKRSAQALVDIVPFRTLIGLVTHCFCVGRKWDCSPLHLHPASTLYVSPALDCLSRAPTHGCFCLWAHYRMCTLTHPFESKEGVKALPIPSWTQDHAQRVLPWLFFFFLFPFVYISWWDEGIHIISELLSPMRFIRKRSSFTGLSSTLKPSLSHRVDF